MFFTLKFINEKQFVINVSTTFVGIIFFLVVIQPRQNQRNRTLTHKSYE